MPNDIDHRFRPAAVRRFAEFVPVALRRPVTEAGVTVPKGTRGIVVHAHPDGIAYEVEFSEPVEIVVTVRADDLA